MRLVLALSSIALVALLLSAVALSQILPGFFIQQSEGRLQSATNTTILRVEDSLERWIDGAGVPGPEVLNTQILQPEVNVAADQIAQATVTIYTIQNGVRGTQAAQARPRDPEALAGQQLAPDPEVQPAAQRFSLSMGDRVSFFEIVVSDPYTSRAATLNQVRGTLIAAGVIALFGSLLLGVFAARQLTGPISRLRRVSARLAAGELDQRAPPSGVVEIDQLGREFNLMADRLSESLRMLEADRDRLREFVADVSHELRTPIAALRMFNELQSEGSVDEATRDEFLERSSEQLRRLEWLSTNLLDLSRIDAGIYPLDMQEGDLREPVRSVVEAHAEVVEERGVSLVSMVPAEPVALRFDRERVVQLVNNLLGNALKFTPPGGEVHVEVSDEGSAGVIEVRDTGPGIPEQELPHIFERFYRGTNVGEARASGSGLGLAIVRSIVEMHGGSIEVTSAVGLGTKFTVRLPRLGEPEQAAARTEASSRPQRLRVLIPRRAATRREAASGKVNESS